MKHIFFITNLVLLGILLIMGCKETSPIQDKRVPVEIHRIKIDSTVYKQGYTGVAEEWKTSILSFHVPGNIEFVNVKDNQKVTKGQILSSINKRILQDNYDAALSTLGQTEDAYKRMELLYKNNSLPEIKWVETQTALQQARSMASIAKENLQNVVLVAPFSGIITSRTAETGMTVSAGTPLFRLTNTDSIKIKISVPENEIAKIQIGQRCELRVPALGNDVFLTGSIAEKGIIANPLSHTYEAKICLNENINALLPGMICHVDVLSNKPYPRIVLPATAIQLDGSHTYVWIVKDDAASRVEVNIGQLYEKGVIINQGLKEGDLVIVNGYQKVSNGMKVKIK